MKIIVNQIVISLVGFLFLSLAHSAETLSPAKEMKSANEMHTNMPATDAMPNSTSESITEESSNTAGSSTKASDEEKAKAEMTGFSRGSVARSIFTTLIDKREPVDKVKHVPDETSDVFYFTELRDMAGQTAKHRWEYKGKVIAEVNFTVRGPRWRVWSKKSFQSGWAGEWKVSVLNGADEVISEEMIAYTEPSKDVMEQKKMDAPMETNMKPNMELNKNKSSESQLSPALN